MKLLSTDHQFTPPKFEIIYRVLMISDASQGSGFLIEKNGYQYLITALHLLNENNSDVKFFWKNDWHPFNCKLIGKSIDSDLAILKPGHNLVPKGLPVSMTMANVMYGQHSFFLGFPLGYSGSFDIVDNGHRPIPFVKWAGVSMVIMESPRKIILDGLNNPGFSGGPVCFTDRTGKQSILGLITGMKEEERRVEHFSDEAFGQDLVYKQNAGLIHVTASPAIDELLISCEKGLALPNNS